MIKQEFLQRIKLKHPNNFKKYDYSLVPNEFKSKDKVKIICNIHGIFEQKYNNHLFGYGCIKCQYDNNKQLSTFNNEIFIKRAKDKHGTKYNYSKVNYVNSNTKITITCPIHGDFLQRPNDHLQGDKCPKCKPLLIADKLKSNTEEFVRKAKAVHGDIYDYSKVDYKDSNTKVIITCKIHGDFLQQPSNHLHNNNCPICSRINKTYKTNEFINKANKVHNNKYEYNNVKYINSRTKISITCYTHGGFLQKPNKHLQGRGCPKCSESKGEKYISQILDNLNIKYIREYKISGYNYRYDFYLPEYNIYIEYHGKQHYKKEEFFGGIKGFNKIKRRDKTKIELVKRSSGLLIILDYKLNTIELIRNELLRIFNLLHPKFLIDKDFTKDYIDNSKVYLYNNGIMHIRK